MLPEHPEEHVALTVSPLLECVLSLHVLLGPKHHALQHAWVRRMRGLEPGLRREIEAFGFVYRRQIPDLLVPGVEAAPESFEQELVRLRRLAPALLLSALGRSLDDHGGGDREGQSRDPARRRRMLERAAADGASRRHAALLLDDPAAFADRLANVFERYWEACFAAEWERVEELLARSIEEAGRQLATVGIWPLLGRLPAHCRVDPVRRELRIELPHEHRVEVSACTPLVLSPSYFVWPHLRVNCDPPWPLAIVYTASVFAREAEPRIPPAELLALLRALGDDTRLRVLELIAERPRTTQELEPLVGLSRAGLSKSIRRLAEVGLISPRRDGYYVVYSLDPGRLDLLSAALGRYLEGGSS